MSSKTSSSKKSSTYKSLSLSPLSFDGIDLASLIRVSPNSLNALYQEFLNTSPDMASVLANSSTSNTSTDQEYLGKKYISSASPPAKIPRQSLGHLFNADQQKLKPIPHANNLYIKQLKEPNKIAPLTINNCYPNDSSPHINICKDFIYNEIPHSYAGDYYSNQLNMHPFPNSTMPNPAYTSLESRPLPMLICFWIDCYQSFPDCKSLVNHIEKMHVDQRNIKDEYTCFWQGCSRKLKPFNARYKLLIHMRVHSGEKPNKCKVSPLKGIIEFISLKNF